MTRDEQTAFIRRTQANGIIFVCPNKDRALSGGEQACENCTCISGHAPEPRMSRQELEDWIGPAFGR